MSPKTSFRAVGILVASVGALATCKPESVPVGPRLLELPIAFHTPNGGALAPDGSVILTVPTSLSNGNLLEEGIIDAPVAPSIARIDLRERISTWYSFTPEDLTESGGIQPMDAAFGPDGHLYITEMNGGRILRINVDNGRAVDADVVVEGIRMPNSLVWNDEVLFVSSSRLWQDETTDGSTELISGVYAFTLDELREGLVVRNPYQEGAEEQHLIVTFRSSNSIGVGADGVTVAADGNLYTAIFEDGAVFRTTFDNDGAPSQTTLLAGGGEIVSADGIAFNPGDSLFYVADIMANAVRVIDFDGNVSTLHENGDTTGQDGGLDEPGAVLLRGRELFVMNADMAIPGSKNTSTDAPHSISVFRVH